MKRGWLWRDSEGESLDLLPRGGLKTEFSFLVEVQPSVAARQG